MGTNYSRACLENCARCTIFCAGLAVSVRKTMGKTNICKRTRALFWLRLSLFIIVGVFLFAPTFSYAADDTICAEVKIEIKQELTLERQAFDAHMRINNGLSHITLQDVDVDVSFTDEEGNSVLASSDPDNTDAIFYIRIDSMENIDDVDGTGTIDPSSAADIHWLIIPAPGASQGLEQGTLYYVGATLTYIIGGEENVTQVAPDYIFVKPMPELILDYFLTTDVFGDDAFTPEIEPPVPFSLGLRVSNTGAGTAIDLKIDAAQPKIVENEQGLLIGFVIEESRVNGRSAEQSLLVDLGDIASNTATTARWIMTCTLSGQFVDFYAGFSHSDELGGELTSLIKQEDIHTHLLVRDALVDLPGRDTVSDFLAKNGDVYRIYESDSTDTEVAYQSASSSLLFESQHGALVHYTLAAPATAGFMYVKLPDPYNGEKVLVEALRSDGKLIKNENAWLSKTRNGQSWDYFVNLFDANTTDAYTIKFGDASGQPQPPVLQLIANKTGVEEQQLSFIIQASDPNETIPVLAATPLPAGADLTDQGDGTGIFDWTPAEGQAGKYEVTFSASDGTLEDSQRVVITINPIGDTDGDGMPDSWEMQHFGTLERDGSGDFDNDGLSDLDEYLYGSNPTAGDNAPSIPVILAPQDGGEVTALQPALVINNSTDADNDTLTYEFEVFSDPGLTIPVASISQVAEGAETTTWTIPATLNDNSRYYWRARATDGYSYSLWAYGTFFVNSQNDPPGAFIAGSPRDNFEVDTQTPVLQVTNSRDIDEDTVTYTFEVYADSGMSNLVASVAGIPAGADQITSWTVAAEQALNDGTWYFWQVTATDEHGAQTAATLSSFFVNTANQAPTSAALASPSDNSEVNTLELDLTVGNAVDLDEDPLTYYFELDTVPTFDSAAKQASEEIIEGIDTTSWHVSGLEDNTRYWWRVMAGDGAAESSWVQGTFFVNTANEAPPAPTLKNPGHQAWVVTVTPPLALNPSGDPDNDSLAYRYEVFSDAALTNLITDGETAATAWTVSIDLADKTRYFWRARAVDEHGLESAWMDTASFFVKDNGPIEPQELAVHVETGTGRLLAGLRVYAFTSSGSYTGKYRTTDQDGAALFEPDDFAEGSYKFRIDYLGQHFWSDPIDLPGVSQVDVIIAEETAAITVTTSAGAVQGVRVYLFSAIGSYLGQYQTTDANGQVAFMLPTGITFRFRADILGSQYWSDDTTIAGGGANAVDLASGGGLFQVTVQEGAASPMEGIKVYLFSQSGTYLDQYQITDASGRVGFDVPEGIYKVRADYLGYQFWSDEALITTSTNQDLTIAHQDIAVTVNGLFQGTVDPLEGIKVYLFSASGTYLGQYRITDSSGQGVFHLPEQTYKVRADYLGRQHWSETFTSDDITVDLLMADAEVTVTGGGFPVDGEKVYVFSDSGTYLGLNQSTDINGQVLFRLPEGSYLFRADHQGSQYWTDDELLTAHLLNPITISAGGGSFTVTALKADAAPLAGVKCYVFNADDVYLGMYGATDSDGQVFFDLADGTYKFRVDHLGYQFWSDTAQIADIFSMDVNIAHELAQVTVQTNSGPVADVRVYLFSGNGTYLGLYQETDAAGNVAFELPVGKDFMFRADILGSQYWSDAVTIAEGGVNAVPIDAGGGLFQITLQKEPDAPMEGIKIYLFSQSGTYLGQYQISDDSGLVGFDVPEGIYKVRADYLGYQFWSADTLVTTNTGIELEIPHQQMEIGVAGLFQGVLQPIEGLKVYLFSATDTYLGLNQITNASGKVFFDLPETDFKVRADWLGRQFWSQVFNWQNITVNVPMADVDISVTGAGFPREGVKVYVFSATDTYLGISETTNPGGKVTLRLPEGAYKFRADYQGSQYWSVEESLTTDQVNPVIVSVGGGAFAFTVLKTSQDPLEGAKSYVFSETGTYLGMYGATNSDGQVFFDLADGTYKFRVDHLGYQFWSPVFNIPTILAADLDLGHQDVTVSVEGVYQTAEPLEGVKVYLFSPPGTYLGRYHVTDINGQVIFNLPDQEYKVRADYLGGQFWSQVFQSQNTTVAISRGLADIYVHRSGNDVAGAKVYLFSESDSYLGWYQTTDVLGKTEFLLPDRWFKFRIDEGADQVWSPAMEIVPGEVNSVQVDLE